MTEASDVQQRQIEEVIDALSSDQYYKIKTQTGNTGVIVVLAHEGFQHLLRFSTTRLLKNGYAVVGVKPSINVDVDVVDDTGEPTPEYQTATYVFVDELAFTRRDRE